MSGISFSPFPCYSRCWLDSHWFVSRKYNTVAAGAIEHSLLGCCLRDCYHQSPTVNKKDPSATRVKRKNEGPLYGYWTEIEMQSSHSTGLLRPSCSEYRRGISFIVTVRSGEQKVRVAMKHAPFFRVCVFEYLIINRVYYYSSNRLLYPE